MSALFVLAALVLATLWVVGAFAPRGVAGAAKGADSARHSAKVSKRGYEALGDLVASGMADRVLVAHVAPFGGLAPPGSAPPGRPRWPDPGK